MEMSVLDSQDMKKNQLPDDVEKDTLADEGVSADGNAPDAVRPEEYSGAISFILFSPCAAVRERSHTRRRFEAPSEMRDAVEAYRLGNIADRHLGFGEKSLCLLYSDSRKILAE